MPGDKEERNETAAAAGHLTQVEGAVGGGEAWSTVVKGKAKKLDGNA